MTTLTTKRHLIKFYLVLVFAFLFLCGLGTLLMFVSIDLLQKDQHATKDYLLPVLSFPLYFLAVSMVYIYWKMSPIITIDKHIIFFGTQTFYLKNIKDVRLTGKMPFRYYFMTFPMEGTAIIFNDGTEKILFDDMYSNSWEIKSFLEQTVIDKQEYKPKLIESVVRNVPYGEEDVFKGNQFTSLRGISLWGVIGFFIVMMFSKGNPPIALFVFFGVFSAFWFILSSWMMHYFVVTKDFLIIKNHNFLWMTKIYPLSEVKEIVYETQGKQPNSMRVITKDFKNKLYLAGTLRDSTWLDMKKELERNKITVRNECIFED